MVLDASGKEAFSAVRNRWRIKDPELNKVAVWTYYEGAARDEGIDAGATTVAFVPERGWFWYIPQHNDRVSVGVVAEGKYQRMAGSNRCSSEVEQNKDKDHLAVDTRLVIITSPASIPFIPSTAEKKVSC